VRVIAVGGGDYFEADQDDLYDVDGFFSKLKGVVKSAAKTISKHAGTIAAVSAFIPVVGPAIGGAALAIKAANGIANSVGSAAHSAKGMADAAGLSQSKGVKTFKSIPADTIVKATLKNIDSKIKVALASGNASEAQRLFDVKKDVAENGKNAIIGAKALYSSEDIVESQEKKESPKQSGDRQIIINIDSKTPKEAGKGSEPIEVMG